MHKTEGKPHIIIADNRFLIFEALKYVLNGQYIIKDIVGSSLESNVAL
jgi:hypothetical protein